MADQLKIPFGKHKGKTFDKVPVSYLEWAIRDGVFRVAKYREAAEARIKDAGGSCVDGRPDVFPVIVTPTDQQNAIRERLSLVPVARADRSRLTVIDAGPGSGKTTVVCWSMEPIYQRQGDLRNYALCAFNRNAKTNLEQKLPRIVSDVSTINSWCGRIQGYKYNQYDPKKTNWIYRELTDDLPEDKKPPYQIGYLISRIIERMRDLCLFHNDADDATWWKDAVEATVSRFDSLADKYGADPVSVLTWLPSVAVLAHRNSKKIDLSEQICRPVNEAIDRTGWRMPLELTERTREWSDENVRHFATLIRSIHVSKAPGLLIDEGQDLCLSQIAMLLAQVWQSGELTIVGDDRSGEYGTDNFQAGQAIFGWRGAFGGSLVLIRRLWKELTGEEGKCLPLSVTHRLRPEIVEAVQSINTVLTTSRSPGGAVYKVSRDQAFEAWLDLPQGELTTPATALWVSRTNRVIAALFLKTLRKRVPVCLRGKDDMEGRCVGLLRFVAGGRPNKQGEYTVTLPTAVANLRDEIDDSNIQEDNPNSFEFFLLDIMEAVQEDATILEAAGLPPIASVGNVQRLIVHFADKDAPRILSTVYRAKGDEADLVIVDDTEKFGQAWGDDEHERDAVCHVACTRAKELMILTGSIKGVEATPLEPDEKVFDNFEFKAGH